MNSNRKRSEPAKTFVSRFEIRRAHGWSLVEARPYDASNQSGRSGPFFNFFPVCVFVGSLSRALESRDDKRSTMADLRYRCAERIAVTIIALAMRPPGGSGRPSIPLGRREALGFNAAYRMTKEF
jgi:hypothetical protein